MVLKYFPQFYTHPPLVCILVYTVLKYSPQFYTHPPLVCILVYMVLKYFPQFYTHPPLVLVLKYNNSEMVHKHPFWMSFGFIEYEYPF